MERIQDLVYTHVQGGQFRWVTVSTLMLALGTILHLVSPSVAGVTPNWTIATYCVAILLTRPSLSQTLGIGLVAALINVLTSKSAFPYGNLLSEPGGALTAALVTRAMLSMKFRKIGGFDLTPVVSGFLATDTNLIWILGDRCIWRYLRYHFVASSGFARQCVYVRYVANGSCRRCFEWCHYTNFVYSGTTFIL